MEFKRPSETAGKAIRCKAAVCRGPGEPLITEEIEVDPPKAWEVRIRVLCTSLCHTDVTFWKMKEGPTSVFPRIFGHEAVGVVESMGENVDEVKEGDVVVPVFLSNCEECKDCKSEKSNLCSKIPFEVRAGMPRDKTNRFRDSNGGPIYHFLSVSSFSEYTVVDVMNVVKINPEIAIEKACLLSCGVATGVGAAWKVAEVVKGSTVAIFGLGAVGLAAAEGARVRGASRIIGVDLNPKKFEIGEVLHVGKKFGIIDFINPKDCLETPINEVIKKITDGGADYCFECIGLTSLMTEAFESCREGWGKTVILGLEMHGSPMTINNLNLLRGRTIVGSLFGGIRAKSDLPLLAQSYMNKELRLDDFITHEVTLQDINTAFDLLLEGKSIRCIIWMDK